ACAGSRSLTIISITRRHTWEQRANWGSECGRSCDTFHRTMAHGKRRRSTKRAADESCVPTVRSTLPLLAWKVTPAFGSAGTSGFEVEVHDSSQKLVWSS